MIKIIKVTVLSAKLFIIISIFKFSRYTAKRLTPGIEALLDQYINQNSEDELLTYLGGRISLAVLNYSNSVNSQETEQCVSFFNDFFQKYINRQLPIGYYREFNSRSKKHKYKEEKAFTT